MHIFNVCAISEQSFYDEEWKLLELQITQTSHPQSVADERADGLDMGKRVNLLSFFCQLEIFYGQ